jgi:hypothetical protein
MIQGRNKNPAKRTQYFVTQCDLPKELKDDWSNTFHLRRAASLELVRMIYAALHIKLEKQIIFLIASTRRSAFLGTSGRQTGGHATRRFQN